MITTSPLSGITTNGVVNRTGPHGVLIVKWSGHDHVTISQPLPNNVTTRACPTNARVNAVFIIPGWSRRASINSPTHCRNPQTRIHEDVYLSSRGRTGNRNMPREVLRQRLQMRFCVHRVHARIARPANLQELTTRSRNGDGISKPLLRSGCRQLYRN